MVANLGESTGPLIQRHKNHRILSESITAGLVILLDAVTILVVGWLIYAFYLTAVPEPDAFVRYTTILVIVAYLVVQSFYLAGLYSFDAIVTPTQQIGKILSISSVVFLVLVAAGFALKISDDYSRVWVFSTAISVVVLLCVMRAIVVSIIRRLARRGYLAHNILIYGATEQAQRFIEQLNQINAPWNRIIGIFDDRHSAHKNVIAGVNVEGGLQELVECARKTRADEVVIALPWGDQRRVSEILQVMKVLPTNIRLSPDLASMRILSGTINYQYGVPLASVYEKPISGWQNVEKRAFDILVSSTMLLLLSPLIALLCAGVKLDSPGPVFFRQRRYGFNNELIKIWKLRTMYVDQQDEKAERLATPDDPRVTKFGSFLRRSSLDELPQLFNVLHGDMSLVGPRPHALQAKAAGQLYQDAVGEYAARHRVKPGLTGWAQVNGWRGETDTHEKIVKRVEHDLYYIENWSVGLDIRILLRTAVVLFKQENAY
ncbi:MAG: undecaprenyl-phosphate glucose phosphotransferase [Gammaproteobacteria bacterium]|nr:undecaprenyl-phosphate glucose phosphotransferase [Gammaproteobacteria bacterium]